jgi:IS5 family transposase
MALGALIIKERYGFSDEDTVQEIRMNPYLQFFIGLPAFQHEAPFDQSAMTAFRKRIPVDLLTDLNDFYTPGGENDTDDDSDGTPTGTSDGGTGTKEPSDTEAPTNRGTLILDATCVPRDIRFPTLT